MRLTRRAVLCLATIPMAGTSARAFGQQLEADAQRLRGSIVLISNNAIIVATADKGNVAVVTDARTLITRNQPADLSAIKAGDYVASAAVKGADGKLHSTELRIFPEALRGLGEGQRPMTEPDKTMTNAAVTEVVTAPAGRTLKVKFKGGESELVVDPSVPITAVVVADASALKPGEKVFVMAIAGADGKLAARRILGN